jgi:nicotinamidase-related amidase
MKALLIVDVQNTLTELAGDVESMVGALNRLAGMIREEGGKVIFIRHTKPSVPGMRVGDSGWQVDSRLQQEQGDLFVDKTASDAFYKTNLKKHLDDYQVSDIYIGGIQTEFCVDTSTRASQSYGFKTTLIADGHTTFDTLMPVQAVIEHHNRTLGYLANPDNPIEVKKSTDLV